jgi:hypothetical protein
MAGAQVREGVPRLLVNRCWQAPALGGFHVPPEGVEGSRGDSICLTSGTVIASKDKIGPFRAGEGLPMQTRITKTAAFKIVGERHGQDPDR